MKNISYITYLHKFIAQTKTSNLRVKEYPKNYKGTKVKVSFGQGNQARIPWIAFLLEPNNVQKGIYPGYLYYKEKNIIILSYCVSETEQANMDWGIEPKPQTIKEYFNLNFSSTPERYGESMVYKVYNINKLPDDSILEADLNHIINKYLTIDFQEDEISIKLNNIDFIKTDFDDSTKIAALKYSSQTTTRFIASLLTKPFLILTGLAGSGKTKLAQAFAEWISEDEEQYALIPVGADWTNREPLLGYVNGLMENKYQSPENGALDLIIRAIHNPDKPYFLILDEMNLSHVERYFADFLSIMESKKAIRLHNSTIPINSVPQQLSLPQNLFLIGTVNIDETTYMFSPKVLDRANVIEFRVSAAEISDFLNTSTAVNMDALRGLGAPMGHDFVRLAKNQSFDNIDMKLISNVLLNFFEGLSDIGAEFGYRSTSEIIRLINQLKTIDPNITDDECLDIAIMQKLLPKLHGSRRKLVSVISVLAGFCLKTEVIDVEKEVLVKTDFNIENKDVVRFPISLAKLRRMYKNAIDHGFASYAEA